jgi:hypothetical protein
MAFTNKSRWLVVISSRALSAKDDEKKDVTAKYSAAVAAIPHAPITAGIRPPVLRVARPQQIAQRPNAAPTNGMKDRPAKA